MCASPNRQAIERQIRAMQAQELITAEQAQVMLAAVLGGGATAELEGSGAIAQGPGAAAAGRQAVIAEDVINLSTTTLNAMSEPVLEESYYWRALAREALGDTKGAVKDLGSALKVHPGFGPAATKIEQLGVEP